MPEMETKTPGVLREGEDKLSAENLLLVGFVYEFTLIQLCIVHISVEFTAVAAFLFNLESVPGFVVAIIASRLGGNEDIGF